MEHNLEICKHIQHSIQVKQALLESDTLISNLDRIISVAIKAYKNGEESYICR